MTNSVFFTSDNHWGHQNVIKYCNRPYTSVEQMDEDLIVKWNETVGKDDHIYILGDIFFCNAERAEHVLRRLNGVKTLIYGNHDKTIRSNKHLQSYFAGGCHDLLEKSFKVGDDKIKIVMCHYAMKVWNGSHYGSLMLYGHSHGTLPDDGSRSMDVGVDAHGMKPVSIENVVKTIGSRPLKALDQHRPKENT